MSERVTIAPTLTFQEAQVNGWYAGVWRPKQEPAEAIAYRGWCEHSGRVAVLVRLHGSRCDLYFSFRGLPLRQLSLSNQASIRCYLARFYSTVFYVSERSVRLTRLKPEDALELIPEVVRLASRTASEIAADRESEAAARAQNTQTAGA